MEAWQKQRFPWQWLRGVWLAEEMGFFVAPGIQAHKQDDFHLFIFDLMLHSPPKPTNTYTQKSIEPNYMM